MYSPDLLHLHLHSVRRTILRVLIVALIVLPSLAALTCKDEVVQPQDMSKLTIALDGVSCTEVWINIHLGSAVRPRTIQLTRDTTVAATFALAATDTTIFDEELLPNAQYTYQVQRENGSMAVEKSDALQVTTMDTTSHNWSFHIETLGGAASSSLYDVAIINDTLAYAVGEINALDSTGQIRNPPYNLAIWDGRNWALSTVLYNYQGQLVYIALRSICVSSANEILIGGNGLMRWNGQRFVEVDVPISVWGPVLINKILTSPSSDIYIVGQNGRMARYSEGSWQSLESGTTLDVADIWGALNPRTGQQEVIAVASTPFSSFDRKIIRISETATTALSDSGITQPLSCAWFQADSHYYVGGSGIYEKHSLGQPRWTNGARDITGFYIYGIRGNAMNDVVAAGGYGEVLHFNGMTWSSYRSVTGFNGNFLSVAVKGDLAIAVGQGQRVAVVAIGRR